ncbi:coenzyme F420-0:L-glutamate ligase [Nocardioides terrisoli]|uniref:coenzyme F420-0:L-glutamate ligase n=1 Tax=Nocardioides terrisoli TaxID=3388267 RepID=UPI00287B7C73|nr:coenzyme F420-0:L-glutamate ligase [Nocardioides marmorisolisilvae]
MSIELDAPDGIGEVRPGADLAAMIATALELRDGDVVVVTSKVVSKAEGRLTDGTRDDALPGETVRVVARRGPVTIVENRLGLVMAAAGIDNSNVAPGTVALLPADPDGSARAIRALLRESTGRNVAVVISDTSGRAWRLGQTDIAIGVAGLAPLEPFAGRVDAYGNPLAVTEPAVADEIAAAAELAGGKLAGRPLVRVRGLDDRVLPPGEDGPGARSVVRPREQDLFSLGAREAVVAAVAGDDPGAFGPPATAHEVGAALARCGLHVGPTDSGLVVDTAHPAAVTRAALVARAHGWVIEPGSPTSRLSIPVAANEEP